MPGQTSWLKSFGLRDFMSHGLAAEGFFHDPLPDCIIPKAQGLETPKPDLDLPTASPNWPSRSQLTCSFQRPFRLGSILRFKCRSPTGDDIGRSREVQCRSPRVLLMVCAQVVSWNYDDNRGRRTINASGRVSLRYRSARAWNKDLTVVTG